MTANQLFQFLILGVCIALIIEYTYIGLKQKDIGWLVLIPVVMASLPLAFYIIVLFFQGVFHPVFLNLVSSMIRFIDLFVIFCLGLAILHDRRRIKTSLKKLNNEINEVNGHDK